MFLKNKMISKETIIAVSTPSGIGAIAVIRVSGTKAVNITDLFFTSKSEKKISQVKSQTLLFGEFKADNMLVDEVIISVFRNPNSYTGEDLIELSCHGSSYIKYKILKTYVDSGVVPAQPGEFTLRAYLNKKIDLTQAEAVSDLIAADSSSAHKLALNQMKGGFSQAIDLLRQKLIEFTALIELELDFSEEDVEFANRNEFKLLIKNIIDELSSLIESFSYGKAIKDGIPVIIAGKPNAGKSSLLNVLLDEDKAIVSEIPGTTRDLIEDSLIIEGVKFRFTDTAGLRETQDKVEAIGVEKAKDKIKKAQILLYLYDKKGTTPEEVINDVEELSHRDLIIIIIENKIDLDGGYKQNIFNKTILSKLKLTTSYQLIGLSTFNKKTIEKLKEILLDNIYKLNSNDEIVITNTRHYSALKNSLKSINIVNQGLINNIPGDLLSVDLKDALYNISSITGKIDIDTDILGTIFSKFCIGK